MQTKEVLTIWSKNKEQVFMYRRYKSSASQACVVVGFHTETGRMGRSKWDTLPDRMWVDVMDYSSNKEIGTPKRVLGRYLSETSYKSIKEYQLTQDKWALERLEISKAKTALKTEFAEVCKSLCLNLKIEDVKRYGFYEPMVVGDMEALTRLLGTLRDAKQYYDSIVEEVVA